MRLLLYGKELPCLSASRKNDIIKVDLYIGFDDGRRGVLKKLQYFITIIWGFLTPVLALDGAQQVLKLMKENAETQGHSTPVEYVLLFLLTAFVCVIGFLAFDALFSAFALPKDGKRLRHFLLNLLLYIILVPTGWFAVILVVSVLKS